jgi:hypothetical protein
MARATDTARRLGCFFMDTSSSSLFTHSRVRFHAGHCIAAVAPPDRLSMRFFCRVRDNSCQPSDTYSLTLFVRTVNAQKRFRPMRRYHRNTELASRVDGLARASFAQIETHPPSLPGLTRQSIFFARTDREDGGPAVKPAGDAGRWSSADPKRSERPPGRRRRGHVLRHLCEQRAAAGRPPPGPMAAR